MLWDDVAEHELASFGNPPRVPALRRFDIAKFAILLGVMLLGVAVALPGCTQTRERGARGAEVRGPMCVRLADIDTTLAIDSRTVLIKLKARDRFLRMDLQNTCSGILFHGFGFSTSTQDLCTTDALHINEVAGGTCMIRQMVPISRAEADALQRRGH